MDLSTDTCKFCRHSGGFIMLPNVDEWKYLCSNCGTRYNDQGGAMPNDALVGTKAAIWHKGYYNGFVKAICEASKLCEARSHRMDATDTVAYQLQEDILQLINDYDNGRI